MTEGALPADAAHKEASAHLAESLAVLCDARPRDRAKARVLRGFVRSL